MFCGLDHNLATADIKLKVFRAADRLFFVLVKNRALLQMFNGYTQMQLQSVVFTSLYIAEKH